MSCLPLSIPPPTFETSLFVYLSFSKGNVSTNKTVLPGSFVPAAAESPIVFRNKDTGIEEQRTQKTEYNSACALMTSVIIVYKQST